MPRKVGVRVNQHYHYIRHVLFRHLVLSSSEPIAVFASFCIFKLSVVVVVVAVVVVWAALSWVLGTGAGAVQ